MNRNRYFVGNRLLAIVRFDPGIPTRDPKKVRVESIAMSGQGQQLDPVGSAFGLPGDVFRHVAQSENVNLADAIARVRTGGDGWTRVLDVATLNSSRSVNSHRSADELQVKLSWKDFPFDARIVRAVLLLHFEGTVSAQAFASEMRRPSPPGSDSGRLIPATYRNLRFVGMGDEVSDDHSAAGDVVSIKARDLTGVLIDTKLPVLVPTEVPMPKYDRIVGGVIKTIRSGSNILEVIRRLLDTLHGTAADFIRGPFPRGITIDELPKLDRRRYPKISTTAAGRNAAGRGGPEPWVIRHSANMGEESYWDAITDLCVSHGLVPFIDRDMLIVQPPRTLYVGFPEKPGLPGEGSFPTPYRQKLGDDEHKARRMVWGGNLESLRFSRKLARIKSPVVRVTSYNPDAKEANKRLLSVIHPKIAIHTTGSVVNPAEFNAKGPTMINPTGQGGSIEIKNVVVQGILDLELLRKIAVATYEAMGRAELGIQFATSDAASWSDDEDFDPNEDPDLLDIRAGDPLELLVTPTGRATGSVFSITELNALLSRTKGGSGVQGVDPTYGDAVAFLEARGWQRADARQLARVLASANLMTTFRVQAASITIDGEEGNVSIQIDARDYIRARADPEDPTQAGGAR